MFAAKNKDNFQRSSDAKGGELEMKLLESIDEAPKID